MKAKVALFSFFSLLASCKTTEDAAPAPASACASAASNKLACPVLPGEFPPPDCDATRSKDQASCGTGGGCKIDESKCGSTSTCLPLGDNTGRSVVDFRIRRLNIAAPDSLAAIDFQQKVTIPSIDLMSPECGEQGAGSWSWLIRLDKQKSVMTTGGAPPSADPFKLGYCFYNSKKNNVTIAPSTNIPVRLDQGGTVFSSGAAEKLNMPLFVGGDPKNAIILPISDFAVRNVKIGNDDNCIGSLNDKALDSSCKENIAVCSKWRTAGSMAGFITLEDADSIDVSAFGQSLCSLLTKTSGAKCPRDGAGNITLKGDYCGKTRSACDCRDSFWVAATFAASAVRINDGSSVPECGEP
jgi:hypothetical protein